MHTYVEYLHKLNKNRRELAMQQICLYHVHNIIDNKR